MRAPAPAAASVRARCRHPMRDISNKSQHVQWRVQARRADWFQANHVSNNNSAFTLYVRKQNNPAGSLLQDTQRRC